MFEVANAPLSSCGKPDSWGAVVLREDGYAERVSIPSWSGQGLTHDQSKVLAYAWAAAFRHESLPAWGTRADVDRAWAKCIASERTRNEYNALLRKVIRERFGMRFSVTGGRGTGYSWTEASPSHDSEPTGPERVVLRLLNPQAQSSANISYEERKRALYRLAGHSIDE